jgi:mono/diheme cytochrome c family protein
MKRVYARWKPARTIVCAWLALAMAAVSISVSGIAATSSQASTVAEFTPQEAAVPDSEALRRGQQIAESACSICHEWDLVESERLSRENWGYIIQAMLVNGSDLSEREIPLVLDYLSTAFPAEPEAAPEED